MAKNTASIPAKITGSTYSAAEFEILRGFVDVPIQTLGIFDGALIELSGTGDYTDKTLAAHTEITFAESAHERGNVHFVQITTPGGYTVTLTKPSAYGLTYPDAFTNGGILAAGVYDFAFAFISGKIKVKFEAITVDGGDVTAPTMTSRTIENAAPTDMVMVFDEVVTGTNLGFTIAGTTSTAFASISGSGTNTITGTMADAAVFGETITLDYSSVSGDIVDGNSNALVTFSGAAVTNNVADATAPTMTSATIENATDSVLDFIFSDAVTITTAGWNIDTDGAALSISSVLSGSGTTTPKFQLSRSVLSTETLNVDYDSGTGNTVKVSNSVELVTFTDTAVTNNVAGAFTPADLGAKLFNWYDGQIVDETANSINGWNDQKGLADFTSDVNDGTWNGSDLLTFDLSNTEGLRILSASPMTRNSTGEYWFVFDHIAAQDQLLWMVTNTTVATKWFAFRIIANKFQISSADVPNSLAGETLDSTTSMAVGKNIVRIHCDGADYTVELNGVDISSEFSAGTGRWIDVPTPVNVLYISKWVRSTETIYYDSRIHAELNCDDNLTAGEITNTYNYLDAKY